jgi:hypothetical protein
MLFGRDPNVSIGPGGEGTKFLDGGVRVGDAVANREGRRIKDADVAA